MATDVGLRRKGNEDAVAVVPAGAGFTSGAIVCDGVGGAEAGEIASRLGIERLAAALAASSGTIEDRIRSGVADANRAIRAHARAKLGGADSGSTMVLALVADGVATVAHVGDSRAYRYRSGSLEQLTRDHTFVAEQVRAGVISADRAATHPLRSRLMRALGGADRIEPEIAEHAIERGDLLLLCSDGLHGMAGDDEIAAVLGTDVTTTAKALIDLANAKGGVDNVSVALYRVA